MYSCLFVTFAFYVAREKSSIHDYIILFSLAIAAILNLPIDSFEEYILPFEITIFETNLTIASFSLIARYFSKKLLFYLFAITTYFTGITVSHALHLENTLIPIASLFLMVTLFFTYTSLPNFCHTKNGIYFITIFTFIVQNTIANATENILFAFCYIAFALCVAVKGFLTKHTIEKVFHSFLSFFIIAVAYIFIKESTEMQVVYVLLYSTVAYFLYKTGEDKHPIFIAHCILTLVHICYIIFSPSYFLTHTLYSQVISYPTMQFLITFVYFTIIISVTSIIIRSFKEISDCSKFNIVKFTFISVAIMTLLETQVFQAMLSNVGSISYTGAILTATLHMLYALITYAILILIKILFRKQKFQNFIKRITTIPQIPMPSLKIPTLNTNIFFVELNQNIKNVHEYTFAIIPAFILFYLIISFIY
ncbi:MAG: hypothetical protein O3A66_01700 [Proteobacteria bacterium]|nr:hypothetical protein [Pseudomonadota bacterium]